MGTRPWRWISEKCEFEVGAMSLASSVKKFEARAIIVFFVVVAVLFSLCASPAFGDPFEETAGNAGTESDAETAATETNAPNVPVSGAWNKIAGGKWKYITSDGALTGLRSIEGKTYFFDEQGIMKTGWVAYENAWYYFNKSGAMKTGWLKSGSKWYYLDRADGKMLTGSQTIDQVTYFLTSSGAMKTGWNLEDETWYYYTRSGARATKWIKDKAWYYLDPDQDGAMQTGRYKVGNAWYISNDSGAMYANKWVEQPDGWYYATKSGALKTGWLKSGDKWYWLQPDKDGLMLEKAEKTIDDVRYAFAESGAMCANTLVKFKSGTCGYATASGAITLLGTYDDEGVVLKDSEGTILTGWQKIAGKWFFANDEGIMQTGWITDAGKRYLLNSSGVLISNNAASQRIVAAAERLPFQGNGYCAKWVNYVYVNAGYHHPNGNARDLYQKYCKYSDLDRLEPGMIIAVPSHTRSEIGKRYGHVAVYMGNGMVRHNTNKLETVSLESWLAYYETTYKARFGWAF